MKKIILLLLTSSSFLLAQAQQNHFFDGFKLDPNPEQAFDWKKMPRQPAFHKGHEKGFLPFLRLDSVVNLNTNKTIYLYNSQGEVIESTDYERNNAAADWTPTYRHHYDITPAEYTITTYRRNPGTGVWAPYERIIYGYNSSGVIVQWSYLNWNGTTSLWQGLERYTTIETAFGEEFIVEIWNVAANDWKHAQKTIHIKDAENHIIEQVSYYWINNEWTLTDFSNRDNFTYDTNGNQIEYISAIWTPATLSWRNTIRYTWVYDATNKLIETADYSWHQAGTGGYWSGFYKYVYFYNPDGSVATSDLYLFLQETMDWSYAHQASAHTYSYTPEGKLAEKIVSAWNNVLNGIVYSTRQSYAYDSAGNITDYGAYNWNAFLENWSNEYREVKAYDLSVDAADLVYPSEYAALFEIVKVISKQTYSLDIEFNDWQLDSDTYYYFSELVTSTHEPAAEALKLFPNPVSSLLTLGANAPKASAYQITDLNGRILQQEKSWNGEGIDVSRLIPGSYVIRLIEGNRVVTGKFIKS